MYISNLVSLGVAELLSPQREERVVMSASKEAEVAEEDEEEEDDSALRFSGASQKMASSQSGRVSPRWPSRVFAIEVVRRLILLCETERAHLDLALAKELQMSGGKSQCGQWIGPNHGQA